MVMPICCVSVSTDASVNKGYADEPDTSDKRRSGPGQPVSWRWMDVWRSALPARDAAAESAFEELVAAGGRRHDRLSACARGTFPGSLLIHGTADTVVPYEQSDVLARALTNAGVSARLVPVEGAEHIFNGYDDIDGVVRLSVDYWPGRSKEADDPASAIPGGTPLRQALQRQFGWDWIRQRVVDRRCVRYQLP
jgi:acetyl esterase/lipase